MRPLVIKKKRLLIFCGLLICFFLCLSWILDQRHKRFSNVNADQETGNNVSRGRNMVIIPPHLNVLEPPSLRIDKKNNSMEKTKNTNGGESSYVSRKKTVNGQESVEILLPKKPLGNSEQKNVAASITVTSIINQTSFVNKTKDLEVVKNKTLAYLGVLGKEKNGIIPKVIFAKMKWNLSVSFGDIGNLMKDTLFFNKLRPLDFHGPALQSSRNRTANFSLSLPLKMGYCDCWELHCLCCVQLVNKQLHLNSKSCANFTFISKSHEIDLTFSINGTNVHKQRLSADSPPLLCMGSVPAVADVCVHFSNMTYRVDSLNMHKSQLLGCTDFSFNIYNKTINAFPVDCFQIPGDPNHHPKHEQMLIPNFVP